MSKRIIGLVLALCLVVGLLPMIALAEEAEIIPVDLKVTTGNNDEYIQWIPELYQGMDPEYAKTTAEGALVLEGTESDYNLKVEWPIGGTATLTMKDATITNDNIYPAKKDTISISGTEAFIIKLQGTNVINGNPTNTSTTTAAYRCASGIYANNKAGLTIKGDSKADTLTIDNKGGTGIYRYYDSLTIESATVNILCVNTSGNSQNAIIMEANSSTVDKTNLTVLNAKLDITAGKSHSNIAILMTASNASTSVANVNKNTSDILFQNSDIRLYRSNSSGSTQVTSSLIAVGSASTVTFDNCNATIYGRHIVARYAPIIKNGTATYKPEGGEEAAWTYEAGADIGTTKITTLKISHVCTAAGSDDFDCTTPIACDVCGKAMGTAQEAHKPAADDGDCTTAVMCANPGCNQVATPAKATHTPEADDGDCTTATKCTVCGTVTTPAAEHKPANRESCDVAANCTVCGKEVLPAGQHSGGTATCKDKAKCAICGKEYGELANHAGGTATCSAKAQCATCGQEYGELLAHTGGTATCKEKAKCTVCGQEYGELSNVHFPEADDGDCTTAVKCTVCETVVTAAKTAHTGGTATCKDKAKCAVCGKEYGEVSGTHAGGTATCKEKAKCATCGVEYGELSKTHTPAADDGDCTTAIKCSICGVETTAAKTAHTGGTATCKDQAKCTVCGKAYGELSKTHTGGTATCKDQAKCTVCGKAYGELSTTHTGGTATCKDKAKCAVCGKEYGEVSKTHAPAADDGDCTTAIKCTVCGTETTAAKTAHAFANDKDASCDNAGCKHTRTLTENPTTGDISILLTAAVALSSAVGFAGVTVLRKKEN